MALVAALVLALAIGLVYGPALQAPLIFDDEATIRDNPSITSLWPLVGTTERPGPFNIPQDMTTSARPLVNLTFAVNYYFHRANPVGYRAVSIVLHFLSALLVWAIVRRTLRLPFSGGRFEQSADVLALAVALLWALHPLQTETVVYITQRTELMMAFFYLATLYCSQRYWAACSFTFDYGANKEKRPPIDSSLPDVVRDAANSSHRRRAIWLMLAIVACLCGMASKEVMVSAPLIVLLYERAFVAGSLRLALRRSWPLYAGLAATWILLLTLSWGAPHGTSAGFNTGVALYDWWLVQCQALLLYLKLVVWPWPLLIHYQWPYFHSFAEAWGYVALVFLMGAGTLVLLWQNRPAGFLGTCVFAILAPTSLVPIPTEMAAERRMYLPLVAIVAGFVVAGYLWAWFAWCNWLRGWQPLEHSHRAGLLRAAVAAPVLTLAIAFGLVSAYRLTSYSDEIKLWQEVVRFQPGSYVGRNNLGCLLIRDERFPEAVEAFQGALAVKPDYLEARSNLGGVLMRIGRLPEAVEALEAAYLANPDSPDTLNNLGVALLHTGRPQEAVEKLQRCVRVQPNNADAHNNLGNALVKTGRYSEAIDELLHALALQPKHPNARNNLGVALIHAGRLPEAIEELEHCVKQFPENAEACNNLGDALIKANRLPEAIDALRMALKRKPDYARALNNLGQALGISGRYPEAIENLRRALALNPDYADAHTNLGKALLRNGQVPQAIEHFRRALELNPNDNDAHFNLGDQLAAGGKMDEAIRHFEAAVRLRPEFLDARRKLADALMFTHESDRAIEQYRAVIGAAPDGIQDRANLARAFIQAKRPEDAIATAKGAIEVARSAGNDVAAKEVETWLDSYRKELAQSREADSATQSPVPER
jgi:tetratricopeptide (TPR) repeat protein